jgi:hypothetical protein
MSQATNSMPAFSGARQEVNITREPVELRHEQHGAHAPNVVHGLPDSGLSVAAVDLAKIGTEVIPSVH